MITGQEAVVALFGGILIGVSATVLLAFNGRLSMESKQIKFLILLLETINYAHLILRC